ncbi:MAG: DUF2752 domain-containing protein [Atopobiaceae bacterium]|nr:DUF2752 domain-containing protein [Atopobiaceae bacterium]
MPETLQLNFGCWIHDNLHIYCPACGGTRALIALSECNILESLRYNPMVLLFICITALDVLTYGKLGGSYTFLCFRKYAVRAGLLIWAVYCVVRDVLLLRGIDIIGDFS